MTDALLLVLVSPILVACALAAKLTSTGPVFFRQVRIGVGGRPFEILKFRTMRDGPGDDAERMQKLLDVLEDLDDVQEVFHNAAL